MIWKNINIIENIEEINSLSFNFPVLIFKHSTRCSMSSVAKARLDREENIEGVDFFYLDLLKHRDISNFIAEKYNVHHESPQILLLHKGECIYDESHNGIMMVSIKEELQKINQ